MQSNRNCLCTAIISASCRLYVAKKTQNRTLPPPSNHNTNVRASRKNFAELHQQSLSQCCYFIKNDVILVFI